MSTQSFESIIARFKSKTEFERHLQQSDKNYQLKVYRVGSMSRQQALNSYKQLQIKYQNKVYQRLPLGWYENERRLFVWFVVCYSKWHKIDINQENLWQQLSGIFFKKDPRLLKYQYMNVLKRQGRVKWTKQQDEILRKAYNDHANGQWNEIAKQLFFNCPQTRNFKTPKNCRQRWNNHLNNEVKKQPFTQQEDRQLLERIKQRGKKWSLIAKQMGSRRTQHQIKNRFNSLIGQWMKSKIGDNQGSNNNNQNNNVDSTLKQYQMSQDDIIERLLRQFQYRKNSIEFNNHSNNIDSVNKTNNINNISSNNSTFITTNNHFPFLNNINIFNQSPLSPHQKQQEDQYFLPYHDKNYLHPTYSTKANNFPILLKSSFQSNQSQQQKRQFTTTGGMTLVYCGNKNTILDKSMTATIEDKLFGNGSQWFASQNKNDSFWFQRSIHHTPCGFFQDSTHNQRKMSQFKLSQKGSFQKSQIAASTEFFKLPRSDMSQQYRLLTSSTTMTDPKTSASMNYQFSNDIKQI